MRENVVCDIGNFSSNCLRARTPTICGRPMIFSKKLRTAATNKSKVKASSIIIISPASHRSIQKFRRATKGGLKDDDIYCLPIFRTSFTSI